MRRIGIMAAAMALAGCNTGFVGPHTPGTACPEVSATRFTELVAAGATRAEAAISTSGTVSMTTGPGIVQCASYTGPKACRRPNALVVRYTMEDGSLRHVHVPAGAQYRFRVAARPTPCEIVKAP